MALDESTDDMSKLENNGISVYIAPSLSNLLETLGPISIDYVDPGFGRAGFSLRIGESNCGDCSC